MSVQTIFPDLFKGIPIGEESTKHVTILDIILFLYINTEIHQFLG